VTESEELSETPFLSSLRIQGRVIGALLMREMITRFGRHNIGFLWLFMEPMLFTLGVMALWTMAGLAHHSSMPITAFAITGYSSVLLWRNTANRCSQALTPNLSLLYHRNVRFIDVLISRISLELAGATMSFITLSIVFTGFGLMDPPQDILKVIQGWFMLAWFGSALGLLIGAGTERSEIVERLWHPAAYLLFPLSGSVFMVEWLPPSAREVILLLPMVHGIEMLREGYFGHLVRAHYDVGYMATVCAGLTLFALALMRDASRRVEPE
jgi:capsular polysaccharide transport system permease protein